MIQQLDGHLNVGRRACDNYKSLAFTTGWRAVDSDTSRTGFHDLDLTCTHVSNLVDLATTFSNDTPNKVVGNVDLLRLQLLRGIRASRTTTLNVWVGVTSWDV